MSSKHNSEEETCVVMCEDSEGTVYVLPAFNDLDSPIDCTLDKWVRTNKSMIISNYLWNKILADAAIPYILKNVNWNIPIYTNLKLIKETLEVLKFKFPIAN